MKDIFTAHRKLLNWCRKYRYEANAHHRPAEGAIDRLGEESKDRT